jgi:hypothetical protein
VTLLRVKLILNEGGEGVQLSQLTDIAEEAEKFLRYLAEDSRIAVKRNEWLARNFENKSVRFDVELESSIPVDLAKDFNQNFEYVDRVKNERKALNGAAVKHRTLVQYAKIAKTLGPHEKLAFGLYLPDQEAPYRHLPLTKREAEILSTFLSEEMTYRGSIHGMIHDIGIEEFFFHLRKATGGNLIRCDFKEPLYQDVHDAAARRHAMVYVHGLVTVRRVDREVTKFNVERIKVAPALSEDRYQAFFGADPDYTGSLSSEDFIERNRDEQQ